VALSEVIGGELRRDAAPGEREPGPDHRHRGGRVAQRAQQVGQQAGAAEAQQHERDREPLRGVARAARGSGQRHADHADRDGQHARVLVAPGALAEHALPEQHQHEQARGERRLHDHQGSQQQGHDLQREAEDREARAEQPARPRDQATGELEPQVRLVGRLLGVQCLQGDP